MSVGKVGSTEKTTSPKPPGGRPFEAKSRPSGFQNKMVDHQIQALHTITVKKLSMD